MKIRNLFSALLLLAFVAAAVQARAGGASSGGGGSLFVVAGQVQRPGPIYPGDLAKLPRTQENVTFFSGGQVVSQSYTGVLLWDLLQSVGVITTNPPKNDILRKIIVVTGSDGYEAVFGAGEISPNFGGNQIMIAYLADGQSLGAQGPARIVAPTDKQGGRFVSMIAKIEVKDGG
jgi:hypothetical protein